MTTEEFKIRIIPWTVKLYPVILRILKDEDETRDALQDLMIKLWNRKTELLQCSNLPAYLVTAARNLSLDRLKVRKMQSTGEPAEKALLNVASQEQDPEMTEKLKYVHKIIEALPEKYRTVLQMRDIDGFTFDEISSFTGFEVTNIRVILSRARNKVKEEIEKFYEYEEQRINR